MRYQNNEKIITYLNSADNGIIIIILMNLDIIQSDRGRFQT